jgi:hypothetical protein
VAVTLSFLTKFLSLIFLPIIFFLKKQTRLIIPLIFIILTAAFYMPYADAGSGLFSGLQTYVAKWEWNASAFALLKAGFLTLFTDGVMSVLLPIFWFESPIPAAIASRKIDLALMLTKGIIILGFSGMVVYYWRRFKADIEKEGDLWPFKLGMIFLGFFMISTSTLHPWYLCWIVPFFAIVPSRAWLLLSGLVVLSYWNLMPHAETGIWQESVTIKFIEYLPFFFLLFFDYARNRTTIPKP